jgi:6,7-dimethyl-8-ribityllumazine synthase
MAEPRRGEASIDGDLKGAHVLVVEARFYDDIADALLDGAANALKKAGASFDRITVPGSLEIPAAIAMALDPGGKGPRYDAAVALGCVIRGDTIHFEIVSNESARALMDLSVARAFPIGNGIITVDNEQQAWERAKADKLDKGGDAARAALSMLRLKRSFSGQAR